MSRDRTAARSLSVCAYCTKLDIGGAENSTVRFLNALAKRGHRVTILLEISGGKLEKALYPNIKRTYLRPPAFGRFSTPPPMTSPSLGSLVHWSGYAFVRLIRLLHLIAHFRRSFDVSMNLLAQRKSAPAFFFTRADQYIQWIRSDLGESDPSGAITNELRRYDHKIQTYICVSGRVMESLVDRISNAKQKAYVVYNILNPEQMRHAAAEPLNKSLLENTNRPLIVTVCRMIDRIKGLRRMVEVAAMLKADGISFTWLVIGDGPDLNNMQSWIRSANLEKNMILGGEISNPFPLYVQADVVAMLSYFEGMSGVVNEARVLCRTVIATDVSGVREQLTNGVDGIVVENDVQSIYFGLRSLLLDPSLRAQLASQPHKDDIVNDESKIELFETLASGAKLN